MILVTVKQDILEDKAKGKKKRCGTSTKQLQGPVAKTSGGDFLSELKTRTAEHAAADTAHKIPHAEDDRSITTADLSSDKGNTEYDLRSAMVKIAKFLKVAEKLYKDLEAARDEAIEACKKLSIFFCETTTGDNGENENPEKAAAGLLAILAEFASNLDKSLKKHDEIQEREKRQSKMMQVKPRPSSSASSPVSQLGKAKVTAMPSSSKDAASRSADGVLRGDERKAFLENFLLSCQQ